MPSLARLAIRFAFVYALAAMTIGLFMVASKDHTLSVAHAHFVLIGWLGLLTVGLLFHQIPALAEGRLSQIATWCLVLAVPVMAGGIGLLHYGNLWADPIAAVGSLAVFLSVLLLTIRVWGKGLK
ncbi:hypothetical protein ACTL6U_20170 [Rhodovibrionaceae bacterium A322]